MNHQTPLLLMALALLVAGCTTDPVAGDDDDNDDTTADDDDDTTADDDDDTAPASCDNGVRDGDETGIDCGGSCPNQDCCTNGYPDYELGELGVDCHGECTDLCYSGTVHYVANDGDDGHDGLSEQTAWQTIGHVNDQAFGPGDAVVFRQGDVWREALELHSSGTPAERITYGAYGPGERPRLLGSEPATGWTQVQGEIWQSSSIADDPYQGGYSYGEVFFELPDGSVEWGRHRDHDPSFSALVQAYDWTYDGGTLFVRSPSDPSTAFLSVEAPQRDACIRFPSVDGSYVPDSDYVEYVTFDHLDIRYALRQGIYGGYNEIEASGLTVTDCHIGYIGVRGGASAYCIAAWLSDTLIQGNVIRDCGRRGVSYNTYTSYTPGLTVHDVVIDGNTFLNGYHTTGPDISTLPGLGHTFTDFTISNNVIDDTARAGEGIHDGCFTDSCTANSIYIEANDGNSYEAFTIVGNIVVASTSRAILVREGLSGLVVAHNTVYSSHPDAYPYALVTLANLSDVEMRNNLFHGTLPSSSQARCVLDEGSTSFALRDYNLYYQDDPVQPITGSENGVGGWDVLMSEWKEWTTDSGFELHAPTPQPPQMEGPGVGDFRLSCDSPAVDAGVVIPGLNDDYLGDAPDLGALEADCP